MKQHEAFPGKYLKTVDLEGKPRLYTIARILMEQVADGEKEKPVAHMAEGDALVLNPTKWRAIADIYGAESDNWIGQQIVVEPSTTPYQGKIVPCMKVCAPKVKAPPVPKVSLSPPVAQTENPGDDMADEIPF